MNISLLYPCYLHKENKKICNNTFVKNAQNIDLIIEDHSHTLFDRPVGCKIKKEYDVIVSQVSLTQIVLRRSDFEFTKFSAKKIVKSYTISVIKKTG